MVKVGIFFAPAYNAIPFTATRTEEAEHELGFLQRTPHFERSMEKNYDYFSLSAAAESQGVDLKRLLSLPQNSS